MAGVGEASAIVGLIATAAKLSQAVVDIAGRYKAAKRQIESFGLEVANLGTILDQLHRLYDNDDLQTDTGVRTVVLNMAGQCSDLFSELENYRSTLYSRPGSVHNPTVRGRTKWVFNATELQYLCERVRDMKMNLLLLMTMQCVHGTRKQQSGPAAQENAEQINLLSIGSIASAQRLQRLEEKIMLLTEEGNEEQAISRLSISCIDAASEARSTRDSILSLFGHQSYHENITEPRLLESTTLPSSESDPNLPTQLHDTQARASIIIENYLGRDSLYDADDDREESEIDEHQESRAKSSTDEGESQPRRASSPSNNMRESFPSSMEAPTHVLLPGVLKRYDIKAPWIDYVYCISYDDREYRYSLEEPALKAFKALKKQGMNPKFELRNRAIPHVWPPYGQQIERHLHGQPF